MQADISERLKELTLEEKASLCSGASFWHMKGIERLSIPSIMLTDGPHGLRKQKDSEEIGLTSSNPATCFPTASALASSWDRTLLAEIGEAIALECLAENVSVILGPGANIKRSPLCGRNFEYFSEDPFLSGEMAKSFINGVQSKGIGTSLKHYAVNNQETRRMTIDAIVDERALREIYLVGYEIAIKGSQPWTVMCAYNRVNGTYAAEHNSLMRQILKEEWGHEGIIVTDWGAMNDRVPGLQASVELEMPGVINGNDQLIVNAVESGQLDEAILDEAVTRLLSMISKAEEVLQEEASVDYASQHGLARRAAGEGAVLLKNDRQTLPIAEGKKIALIGRFAKEPRYQGGGSSLVEPTRLDNLYDELCKFMEADLISYAPGYEEDADTLNHDLIDQALAIAKEADVVVVCGGLPVLYEIEGLDRSHIDIPPAHNALIASLANAHPSVIVVLSNGSPIAMPWVDDVDAILEGYLGGQAGAGGLADILLGEVNPSGKLAETFPVQLADDPSHHYFPAGPKTVEYRESIYVGYRYFDSVDQAPLFPFGHGLSYTQFEYSNARLSAEAIEEPDLLTVSCRVKNIGERAGKEIVQLYVRDVESTVFRPQKELKGFEKVSLEPGEEKEVTFELDRRAFAYYSPKRKDWVVESGEFEILIAAFSRDVRQTLSVSVTAAYAISGEVAVPETYYHFPKGEPVSQDAFASLLGRPLPSNEIDAKGSFTLNTPISDMQNTFLGRQLHRFMQNQTDKLISGDIDPVTREVINAMLEEAPLRLMFMMGEGKISRKTLEGLVDFLNGNYWSGLKRQFSNSNGA